MNMWLLVVLSAVVAVHVTDAADAQVVRVVPVVAPVVLHMADFYKVVEISILYSA
ncbi:MAG: hypothetical protein ACLVD9_04205 [Ruminococcus sp.]|jgi:hypothetical protein|uniref:hypothetical protein n=2 Tax=Ruminococcus sp. TaxID=41978 RepID=UPI00399A1907